MSSEELNSEDEEMFYPIVDIQEGISASVAENCNIDETNDSSEKIKQNAADRKGQKITHRKMIRRKLEDDLVLSSELDRISKEKQIEVTRNQNKLSRKTLKAMKKLQKREKKIKEREASEKMVMQEDRVTENGFEFCTLKDMADIKEEVVSDGGAEKTDDESDDDVPLSRLETKKDTSTNGKVISNKRTYAISADRDSSHDDGTVKKLTIKKVIAECPAADAGSGEEVSEFRCTDCDKTFKNGERYNAHITRVHRKPFYCTICLKSFRKRSHLEDHFNTHTGHRPYSCYLCGKMFKTESSLKKHTKVFHSDSVELDKKQYSCDICFKVLSSATCLEEHVRLHTGEKPINCELCGKLFTRERDMKLHLNLHQESWKCDLCQRCFITPFKLKEHYRSHTGELPYECDKCDRKFARVADFRYHIGTHLGLKPYACDMCGMRFTTSSSVTRHRLNMHQAGPRPFTCQQCPKRFHTQSRLNTHTKNHENKRKYRCELCPAARSSPAELAKHAAVHGGEFRCDTCHRGCASAERLAAHAARHELAGKPYACFVCSLGYRSSQSLNKHLATVHKDEDVPRIAPQHLCTLCGQVFELKDKLNRHLKDSHIVLVMGDIIPIDPDKVQTFEGKDIIKLDVNEDSIKIVEPITSVEKTKNNDEDVIKDISKLPEETTATETKESEIKQPKVIDLPNITNKKSSDFQSVVAEHKTIENYLTSVDNCKVNTKDASVEKEQSESSKVDLVKNGNQNLSVKENNVKNNLFIKEDIVNNDEQNVFIKEDIIKNDALNLFVKNDIVKNVTQNLFIKDDTVKNVTQNLFIKDTSLLYDYSRVTERKNTSMDESRNAIKCDSEFSLPNSVSLPRKEFSNLDHKILNNIRNANTITIPQPFADISGVKDLSAATMESKMQKAPRPSYDNPYARIPYNETIAAMTQHSRLLQSNSYRNIEESMKPFDGFSQIQASAEHAINPWFLGAKPIDKTPSHRHMLQRYGDLRLPRLDPATEQLDYANFNNHRLQSQRVDTSQAPSPQPELNDRKYYYDGITDRKNHMEAFSQKQVNLEERRKYPNVSSGNVRNFQHSNMNVQSPLSVRDLSNLSEPHQQTPHYAHHSLMTNTPHHFFRDLQQRMFGPAGIQNYGHPLAVSGMDMTRQMNPASPLSPYSSPHLNMDNNNESPISRQSYEDLSNPNAISPIGYQSAVNRPVQNGEANKDGGSRPYEMRSATT